MQRLDKERLFHISVIASSPSAKADDATAAEEGRKGRRKGQWSVVSGHFRALSTPSIASYFPILSLIHPTSSDRSRMDSDNVF